MRLGRREARRADARDTSRVASTRSVRRSEMSIVEYKKKIKELKKNVEYLEKEMNKEIQIMFWRKFCKLVDIDFRTGTPCVEIKINGDANV